MVSMRRYLIIGAVAVVLLGVGAVAFLYFHKTSPAVVVAPAGNNTTLPTAEQTVVPDTTSSITAAPVVVSPRLIKITAGPVVPGEVVITKKAVTASSSPNTTITFIARESGNVFSYFTQGQTLTRTSNKTLPGIQSASWLPDGSVAFVRYLSGPTSSILNTYALSADGVHGGNFFLPQDLADISVSSTSVLALASGVNGSIASVYRTDGSHPTEVFSTPLSSLRTTFLGKGQFVAFTKPASSILGDVFAVDGARRLARIAGPLYGLAALASPSGKWVLVSYTLNALMQMELVNTATNEVVQLPVATIADKCVWAADDSALYCGIPVSPSANAAYPDSWYQGAVSFTDRLWKINVSGRYAQLVLDFSKETNVSLDAEALSIDAFSTTLAFINKNDGSLWSYSL